MSNLQPPFYSQNMLLLATRIVEATYEPVSKDYSESLSPSSSSLQGTPLPRGCLSRVGAGVASRHPRSGGSSHSQASALSRRHLPRARLDDCCCGSEEQCQEVGSLPFQRSLQRDDGVGVSHEFCLFFHVLSAETSRPSAVEARFASTHRQQHRQATRF